MHRVHGVAGVRSTPEPVSRRHDPEVTTRTDLASDVPAQQTIGRVAAFGAVQLLGIAEHRPDPVRLYNPFDVASGQQIGSNYDSTGNETQGRVTVVFRGNWAQATDVARTNVQGLELVEMA